MWRISGNTNNPDYRFASAQLLVVQG